MGYWIVNQWAKSYVIRTIGLKNTVGYCTGNGHLGKHLDALDDHYVKQLSNS